jgi:hypothetical protein
MRTFKPYNPDQLYLLPPALRDWLPEGHLALFISDVVDTLDLEPLFDVYEQGDGGGQPPYHPAMMVKLVYCPIIILTYVAYRKYSAPHENRAPYLFVVPRAFHLECLDPRQECSFAHGAARTNRHDGG